MRSLLKLPALLALAAALLPAARAQEITAGRVVLVLPFDNRSGNPSLSWIGDSFPNTLNKRLVSAGFLTISHDDRSFAYDHLGLPTDFRPSRATTIRIAQQLDASYVVVGSFNVTGDKISVQAQVLDVTNLRLSAPLSESADLQRLFDAENATAWRIARFLDPHFNVAEQTFLAAPGAVSLSSFENYIRGTNASAATERIKRLQAAVNETPGYAAALLALGKEQYAAHDYTAAAATFSKVPKTDTIALEANFYLGLATFNSAKYAQAETAFAFVAQRLPLAEVTNNQGVAVARQGRNAVALFQQATNADPNDEDYRYNLAVALFRQGDLDGAKRETEAALKLKPADSEATELRARLNVAAPGMKLVSSDTGFSPVERIRRTYSEAGFRQAAFQLDQVRAMRLSTLPAEKQVAEYTQLGRDYLAQGLLLEAEQQFQSAIIADPSAAAPHAGLAEVRERSGVTGEARSEAEQSVKLQPNAAAYLVLARLNLATKDYSAAASDASQALHLEPRNTAALALRSQLQSLGQTVP